MAERNFFSRLIRGEALLRAEENKQDAVTNYSKASLDRTEIAFADTTYFQKPQGKKALEVLYRNSWPCFKAVNVRANLLSGRGLKIKCKSDKAKEAVKEMLLHMHPSRPMIVLQESFRLRSINADIWGNAFDELLYAPKGTPEKPIPVSGAKDLLGFSAMHPVNTDFIRMNMSDEIEIENGSPKGYVWRKDPMQDTMKGVELELARVGHLKYNLIADELLGMSTLEPIYKTAESLRKIEEGMAQGVLTYGNPTRDFIVGDESHPPTKAMIDNTADEVKGFNLKSEYVHPPWIRVGQMEAFSLSKIPNYMQPYITAIAAATGVPEFVLLGRGEGTNKATAESMISFIHQTIDPLQNAQTLYFEEQILAPLMKLKKIEEIPQIEWNEILPKNLGDYANIIKTLSEIVRGGKPLVSDEELREMADLNSARFETSVELSKKETQGILLTAPHGRLIWEGKKTLIIKSKDFSNETLKPLILVSDNKAYGVIKLRQPEKISLEQFDDLKKEHMISEEERQKWWPGKDTLFTYKFNILQKFDPPKDYKAPEGVQVFIKDVKLDAI